MAKGKRIKLPSPNQSPRPISSNEAAGNVESPNVEDLLVPALKGLPEAISNKTALVTQYHGGLTLQATEFLMQQVKIAQANATEALNRYSSYRSAVARLLELRRREAAAVRKAEVKNKESKPETPEAEPTSFDSQVLDS